MWARSAAQKRGIMKEEECNSKRISVYLFRDFERISIRKIDWMRLTRSSIIMFYPPGYNSDLWYSFDNVLCVQYVNFYNRAKGNSHQYWNTFFKWERRSLYTRYIRYMRFLCVMQKEKKNVSFRTVKLCILNNSLSSLRQFPQVFTQETLRFMSSFLLVS